MVTDSKKGYNCKNCHGYTTVSIYDDPEQIKCCKNPSLDILWVENPEEVLKEMDGDLRRVYEDLIYVHNYYLDWNEDEIKLQSLWDIATYFHNDYNTFPYRFITAMKGSGKTRLQNLTKAIARNALLTVGMSDSALFRSAEGHTLLFDEAESIGKKEKQAQREILNSGYKKGASIIKSEERRVDGSKKFINQEYKTFGPKMLTNIWGMEEVLGSRCIPSILEKSRNPINVKMIEDFEENKFILDIKRTLERVSVVKCSVVTEFKCSILERWNNFIYTTYSPSYNNTKLHLTTPTEEETRLFKLIDSAGLDGRDLELYMPLFFVAKMIGEDILIDFIRIAKEKTSDKADADFYESNDVAVYDFISQLQLPPMVQYISIKDLTHEFRVFFQDDDDGLQWLNPKWMGRALKRLQLVEKTRRVSRGVEVIPNISKAKEKIGIFKKKDKDENEVKPQ